MKTGRLNEILDESTVELAWLTKNTLGCVIVEDKHIVLNIWLQVVMVAVHEIVHIEFPDASEKKVDRITSALVERMTVDEIKALFDRVCRMGVEYNEKTAG